MSQHTEIPSPNVEGLRSDMCAIHKQLQEIAETQRSAAATIFAQEAARAVESANRPPTHTHTPVRLPDVANLQEARENASRHLGLCGKYQTDVIAAVRTEY